VMEETVLLNATALAKSTPFPEFSPDPASDLVWAITSCGVVYLVSWFLLPQTHMDRKWAIMDLIFSVPYYPFISALALNSVFALNGKDHFLDYVSSSYLCLLFYAAGNIIHIPITFLKDQERKFKLQMLVHHLLSITCYVNGLLTLRMHYFGTLDALCEISTIYLNFVFLFKEFGAPQLLQSVNGIVLWVTYLFLRIFLFPKWLHMYATEILANPSIWNEINWVERYLCPITTLILFILSSFWMVSITKGLIKNVKSLFKPTTTPSKKTT